MEEILSNMHAEIFCVLAKNSLKTNMAFFITSYHAIDGIFSSDVVFTLCTWIIPRTEN